MSLRSYFSRLFSASPNKSSLDRRQSKSSRSQSSWRRNIVRFLFALVLILSAIWLLMMVWYQFGASSPITWATVIVTVGLLTSLLSLNYRQKIINKLTNRKIDDNKAADKTISTKKTSRWLAAGYALVWLSGLGWFLSLEPQQNRDWQTDVSQRLSYERDPNNPNLITFTNVRNFDWYVNETDDPSKNFTERWETRTVDMSKLSGVDVTNSYWMGPLIAHTLVSFRFEDERPLSFSLEIRKEKDESFSALAGFFRRFELSLIASEERDIIYTRSNVRGEQVYLFPISHLHQSEVQDLFESYLVTADDLNDEPAWYNTLTSNCTNIIFYMARIVSGERLPWDYRIWVSGWLPNYLYEIGMLPTKPEKNGQPWSMEKWYQQAHINPKVRGFDNTITANAIANNKNNDSDEFSKQIRQGIPIPPLADSKAQAERHAQSAAMASEE